MSDSEQSDFQTLVARLEELLARAEEQLKKTRKRHDSGVSHESHLSYAEGLRDGLQSAKDAAK